MVKASGGIDDRQIEQTVLDDAYLPVQARSNVESLIQDDGVIALVGVGGTDNNIAVQQLLEETAQCAPNLAGATGYPGFSDPGTGPCIINGLSTNRLEAPAFADYLGRELPEVTVAILAQNDVFGETLVDGFTSAIDGTEITIVAKERFDLAARPDRKGESSPSQPHGRMPGLSERSRFPVRHRGSR